MPPTRAAPTAAPSCGERSVAEERPTSIAIARTAWLHGVHGRSFVRTMIDLESRHDTLDVVDVQRGQPTGSADVAARLADLGPHPGRGASGVRHATGCGEASWCEPAREVFPGLGTGPDRVRPVSSGAFPRSVTRPAYRALAHGRRQELGLPPLRDWRSALHEAFPLIRKESSS
ncbi:sugar nucleotide-binding protein [Streptomyces sp. NPDC001351]|uniref:sugar nucleotide-binding protein n=1 Tax=Streptomyces sp. NPDC001351 TaxID=3364564 RepID=UPI0036BD424C